MSQHQLEPQPSEQGVLSACRTAPAEEDPWLMGEAVLEDDSGLAEFLVGCSAGGMLNLPQEALPAPQPVGLCPFAALAAVPWDPLLSVRTSQN